MAGLAAVVATVVGAGASAYGVSEQAKAAKDQKKQAQTLIDQEQKATLASGAAEAQAAQVAATRQRAAAASAFGPSATVLTGPRGPGPAPTQRKTLLGL